MRRFFALDYFNLPDGVNVKGGQFARMSTLVLVKKSAQTPPRRPMKRKFTSKYAFGPFAKKVSGTINTGLGNLSTREGFGN